MHLAYMIFFVALLLHYRRERSEAHLEEAIGQAQAACSAAPGHSIHAAWMSNFADALEESYSRNKQESALQDAVQIHREIFNAPNSKVSDHARYLPSSGERLQASYQIIGSISEPDAGIEVGNNAVDATQNHPRLDIRRTKLGEAYVMRSCEQRSVDERHRALELFTQSLDQRNAAPLLRLRPGLLAAGLATKLRNWNLAAACFEESIDLIPRKAQRSISENDLQY